MKVAPTIISSFAKFIIGGDVFNHLLSIVTFQQTNGHSATGAEKRAYAIEQFKHVGLDVANWMLNLGIELAVAYLKALEARNK